MPSACVCVCGSADSETVHILYIIRPWPRMRYIPTAPAPLGGQVGVNVLTRPRGTIAAAVVAAAGAAAAGSAVATGATGTIDTTTLTLNWGSVVRRSSINLYQCGRKYMNRLSINMDTKRSSCFRPEWFIFTNPTKNNKCTKKTAVQSNMRSVTARVRTYSSTSQRSVLTVGLTLGFF